MIVNNLTTQHSFRTLSTDDYIVITIGGEIQERRTYKVDRNYSNLTMNKLATLLNKIFTPDFTVYFDDENKFVIYSIPFQIVPEFIIPPLFNIIDMSYNFKALTGTLQTKFPMRPIIRCSWIAPRKRYIDIKDDDYLVTNYDYFVVFQGNNVYSTHVYTGKIRK
jgi:hypothetical protein